MKTLPYVFDLLFDVKTVAEFKREYSQSKEKIKSMTKRVAEMERLAEEHKLKLK